MSHEKYIGMDVHQATISAAVSDAHGKLIMECLLETKAGTIVEFIRGLQGTLSLTFKGGLIVIRSARFRLVGSFCPLRRPGRKVEKSRLTTWQCGHTRFSGLLTGQ
jgi:hypothetical protein